MEEQIEGKLAKEEEGELERFREREFGNRSGSLRINKAGYGNQ